MLRTFIARFWPSLLVFGFILYATLSSNPTSDVSLMLFPDADKLIHAIMFGGFTGAILFDLYRSGKELRRGVIVCVALGVALFGVLDECAQAILTVERSGDVLDWLADVGGIIIASLVAPPVIRYVVSAHD